MWLSVQYQVNVWCSCPLLAAGPCWRRPGIITQNQSARAPANRLVRSQLFTANPPFYPIFDKSGPIIMHPTRVVFAPVPRVKSTRSQRQTFSPR